MMVKEINEFRNLLQGICTGHVSGKILMRDAVCSNCKNYELSEAVKLKTTM